MQSRFVFGSAAILACAMSFATLGVRAQVPIVADYVFEDGVLSAATFRTFSGVVPDGKQLDFQRDVVDAALAPYAKLSLHTFISDVWGAPNSNFYSRLGNAINHGPGLVNVDYARVTCMPESTGPCIAHKTALRAHALAGYGQWLYSDNVGPGTQAVRWITADNPSVYGDVSYAVPHIDVIQNDVDVTAAVIQWNVSSRSTGDFVRIIRPSEVGGGYAFRITKDGQIFINEMSLDQYIAKQVAIQLGLRAGPGPTVSNLRQ
jgi:hypothetical protein